MAELKKTWNGQTCAMMMSCFKFPVCVCREFARAWKIVGLIHCNVT